MVASAGSRRAFSLGELLLTVALLVLLVGVVSVYFSPIKEQRGTAVAREELHRVRDAVEAHRLTAPGPDRLPLSLTETAAFPAGAPEDPWGQPYEICSTPPCIFTRGPDGEAGTPDDISAALSRVEQRLLKKPSPRR